MKMSLLKREYLNFDKDDVKLLQNMMKKFYETHQGAGMPDYSPNFIGYLPVATITLLKRRGFKTTYDN